MAISSRVSVTVAGGDCILSMYEAPVGPLGILRAWVVRRFRAPIDGSSDEVRSRERLVQKPTLLSCQTRGHIGDQGGRERPEWFESGFPQHSSSREREVGPTRVCRSKTLDGAADVSQRRTIWSRDLLCRIWTMDEPQLDESASERGSQKHALECDPQIGRWR